MKQEMSDLEFISVGGWGVNVLTLSPDMVNIMMFVKKGGVQVFMISFLILIRI